MFTTKQLQNFAAYKAVQKSAQINMYDALNSCRLSGLTRDEYMFVLKNYTALKTQSERQESGGGAITVDLNENRVKIESDERQSDEVIEKLKRNGFKWSRTNQCRQRLRTENALWAAKKIVGVKETANGETDDLAD